MFLNNSDCRFDPRSALTSAFITHLDSYSRLVNPKRWNENRALHEATYQALLGDGALPDSIARHFSEDLYLDYLALTADVRDWIDARYAQGDQSELDRLGTDVDRLATQLFCCRSFAAGGSAFDEQPGSVDAAVIIPFRARDRDDGRLRNLVDTLSWLEARRRQPGVQVIVVEADSHPRHRDVVEAHGATHEFVGNAGLFNKAAAVNRGYARAGKTCRHICILDSDGYLDEHFLRLSLGAIAASGSPALMPFNDLYFLDRPSTERVLAAGLHGAGEVTGYVTRLSPGVCFWVSSDLFEAVGGFDEKYEGWGGEDRDFFTKVEAVTTITRMPGVFAHMFHERAPEIIAWAQTDGAGEWRHNYTG